MKVARVLFMAFPLFALASLAGAQTAQRKIGVVLNTQTSLFDVEFKKAIEAEAATQGIAVTVRAPVNVQANVERIALLESLAATKPGLIMFSPRREYEQAFLPSLKQVDAKGIKVIALLEPIEGSGIPRVGLDLDSQVNLAVELCSTLVSDGDEFGMLRSNNSDGRLGPKESKFIQGLKKIHPRLVLHMDRFSSVNADPKFDTEQTKGLINAYPNLKLIYCAYTQSAIAAIRGIRETGKAGKIHIVCLGSSLTTEVVAALEDGTIDGWVAVPPDQVARRALAVAKDMLDGKPAPEHSLVGAIVVTKQNLRSPEVGALIAK